MRKESNLAASIDNLYDAIRAEIPTYSRFVNKKEILNTYSLEDNPETFMTNSWGIKIGSGFRSEKDDPLIDNFESTVRTISIIISRAVYDVHGIGIEANETAKDLALDAQELRANFLNTSKFGILKGGEEVTYEGDSGIEFIQDGQHRFIYTQVDFSFEIVQQIN